ncbi:hypothetical protein ONZ43_g3435 [Nemania bipapillata]|uniref:Uncharacterized protein n=1 Tax=Nemania bipapillata TaxID=110536 RepID=A0ACC2IX45_9PEZI|nr:hypothetical protein ONZ43_g3435 [Nemania bipapillata]
MRNFIGTLAAALPLAAAAPYGLNSRDSPAGCSSKSFGDFAWAISNFNYHASYVFSTPAHQIDSGTVGFNLTNTALSETVACTAYSLQLQDYFYGNINYNCTAAEGSSTSTTFSYSRPSGQLNINQTWTCDDEDPQYPITFTAYGTVNLTFPCDTWTYQNPDWQPGQTYSILDITCGSPFTLPLVPYEKTAIA